jgi:hypothetical protein
VTPSLRDLAASLAIVATAFAIAGCGGSEDPEGEKLPAGAADELRSQLKSISERVAFRDGGACDDIFKPAPDGNLDTIDATMASIPARVDPDVRAALEQSIDRLKQLIDTECEEIADEDERERQQQEESAPEEEPTTPTPTPEEPVETTPTPTETGPQPTPEDEQDGETPPAGTDGGGSPDLGGGGVDAPPGDGEAGE